MKSLVIIGTVVIMHAKVRGQSYVTYVLCLNDCFDAVRSAILGTAWLLVRPIRSNSVRFLTTL